MAASSRFSRSGFEQDPIGHADLADVVQQRGDFQLVTLMVLQVQVEAPGGTAQRHAQTVSGGRGMLGPQRHKQTAGQPKSDLHQLVLVGRFDIRGRRQRDRPTRARRQSTVG